MRENHRNPGLNRAIADVLRPGMRLDDRFSHAGTAIAHWVRAGLARESEHRTGFLWYPIAAGLGILAYFAAAEEPSLWAGPGLAALSALGLWRAQGAFRLFCITLLMVGLGFAAGAFRTAYVTSPMLERDILVEVKGFAESVESMPSRQRYVIRPVAIEGIAPEKLPFRLRVGAAGRNGPEPGAFVSMKARLQPPSEAALPGGYDFRRDSFFRSTGGVGYTIGPMKAEVAPVEPPLALRINAAIDRWRNALTHRIAQAIGGDSGALAAALITGKRGLISEATNDDLRAAGLYHVVSISGLHMVLAAGVLFWSIRALLAAIPAIALRHPIKKYAALAAMLGATFYCIFSGNEVATERSLLMTLVMLGAVLVDRPALAMRNLAISALIVMAREPEQMLGPSFQMSYAAVAGLIAANQVWKDWRATHPAPQRGPFASLSHKILMSFVAIGATTLVATLATAPFSAYHFHRLNPYGIIGNSLGIPMVSLIVMPAAVIGTLLVPFGLDGVVWHVMGVGISGMLIVAQWVAGIENASVTAPNMEGPAFAMLVIAIIAFVALRSSLRWLALVPFGLWLVQLQAPHLPDLVIDPTGRMALARGEGGHYRVLAVGTPSRFTLSQWLPALGDGRAPSAASLREGVRCDKFGCVSRLADGRLVALSTRPDTLREDCRRADIVITPLRGIAACEGKRLLDRGHFDRYGATRIMTANAAEWRLDTSLDPAIKRPWRRPVAQHQNPAALTGASDPTSSADDASRNKRLQGHDAYQSDESRQKSGRAAKSLRIRPPHMPDSAGDDPALIPPLKAHYP